MKINKIILESDYNKMLYRVNDCESFQNTTNYYCTFGNCGASITNAKNGSTKIVNYWRNYSYKELCDKFDSLNFE